MASLEALQRALAQSLVAPPGSLVAPPGQGEHCDTQSQTAGHTAGTRQQNHDCSGSILAGISQDELRRGRQTLRRKRLSQTRSLLPRTTTALAERYGRLFEAYAEGHHFSGHQAPLLDAVGFSRFLTAESDVPAWVCELARWEALTCRWTLHANFVAMLYLRYDICGFAARITWQEEPKKQSSLWIACRLFGRGVVRRLR